MIRINLEVAIKLVTLCLMSISVLLLADITGKITALVVEDVFGVIINRPFDGIIYIAYCVVISRSLSRAAANVWNVKTKKR